MTNDNVALRNKELFLEGFNQFAAGNIDVLRTLLHDDFLEHSPGNPSGKDAFLEFIAQAPVTGSKLELARVIADDEYVVIHYRMVLPDDAEPDQAVVDIWRVVDGKIVEHWDVVQPVPEPAQIPHGMF
ncbi:nuclear transport factor 2 family protein [Nocardia abscessus]|uniref:nuclear transport factor 2 family protein n=1 Tax=Nocardia TaxID=1817 RepID=UPI001894B8CB|nr:MULTISPECIES: nuclear transport factor 2 family protein [Nocardia]MBF6220270.1 nuclear transport factor 2 family protein [Nocardia abscessus]MDE1675029.1 nuclear transport factor 2 family protein [Nocardia gipuzkoensis]